MKKTKLTIADIIDGLMMIGGFGFVLSILAMIPSHGNLIAFQGLLLLLGSFGIGSLGTARLLLRQKENKIQALQSSLMPQQLTQIPQNTPKDDLEIRFLEALLLQKGRITLTEAVVLVRESIDKLQPVIQRLQQKGVIGTDVDDKGQIVYVNN
jgi:hypothetical protein